MYIHIALLPCRDATRRMHEDFAAQGPVVPQVSEMLNRYVVFLALPLSPSILYFVRLINR